MATKKQATTTSSDDSEKWQQLFSFVETYSEKVISDRVSDLSIELNSKVDVALVGAKNDAEVAINKAKEEAKDQIQIKSDEIRNQVLTALGLFAAFFSLISAGTLVLIKSPTPGVILVVIGSLTFSLLIFLSLFFVFLNNRLPSIKVLWFPILVAMVFAAIILMSVGLINPNAWGR